MAPPSSSARAQPSSQVADDRLARHEELVHQDLPRADREASLGDQPADQRLRLGPDLEVVVDGGRLAVEREAEPRILLHPVEQLVDQLDETHPERLERLVPLAIPMGVRHEVDDGPCRQRRRLSAIGCPICAA